MPNGSPRKVITLLIDFVSRVINIITSTRKIYEFDIRRVINT